MASERLWCSLLRPAALALLFSPLSRGFSIYKRQTKTETKMTTGFNSKQQKRRNRDTERERERGGEDNKGFDPRRSEKVMKWIFVTIKNKRCQMCELSTLASVSGYVDSLSRVTTSYPSLLSLNGNVYWAQIVIWRSHDFAAKCVYGLSVKTMGTNI